ncbi:hypothetical protein [Nocardia nova]|uniref:hypothetical protein n=1 Tax=Nocardia nova TaxID=37330 RepID=UPI003403CC38
MSIPEPTEMTRIGIEILTLWVSAPADDEQQRVAALKYIDARLSEPDAPEARYVIRGLLQICELLLINVAALEGVSAANIPAAELQWLRRLSVQLPE